MRIQRKIDSSIPRAAVQAAFILIFSLSAHACGSEKKLQTPEASLRDTCDGPDVNIECNFTDFPKDAESVMKIAGDNEPGIRLVIKGRLVSAGDGSPLAGVMMYAYQTDSTGHYTKTGEETGPRKWQGRLHGWCITDSDGRYEIHTVRPGGYPGEKFPAHIHCAVKIPGKMTGYINDFVFSDDEYVDEKYLSGLGYPGDNGVLSLRKEGNILIGERLTEL